jgi:hypothetical protein
MAEPVEITEQNWRSVDLATLPQVSEHLLPGSKRLYLFFGGFAGSLGMPPFEFFRSAQLLGESKIFFRDIAQAWYQRGLPGVGASAWAVGEFLQAKIEESGAEEVRFVGNSMGGFAALLFCAMLGRGRAFAFVPQTFICPDKRARLGDDRWPEKIAALHGDRRPGDIYDLAAWIAERHPGLAAQIHVSAEDRLDLLHAEALADLKNVNIHRYGGGGGHELVRWLRDEGKLATILRS